MVISNLKKRKLNRLARSCNRKFDKLYGVNITLWRYYSEFDNKLGSKEVDQPQGDLKQ